MRIYGENRSCTETLIERLANNEKIKCIAIYQK